MNVPNKEPEDLLLPEGIMKVPLYKVTYQVKKIQTDR
jgi:hypothetical protein